MVGSGSEEIERIAEHHLIAHFVELAQQASAFTDALGGVEPYPAIIIIYSGEESLLGGERQPKRLVAKGIGAQKQACTCASAIADPQASLVKRSLVAII